MPTLVDSPPPLPAADGPWGSLYHPVQEPLKPRHALVAPAPSTGAKRPAAAYGGRKNLETCTEALGCETGAVDAAPAAWNDADEAECAERKRRAREEEEEEGRARQFVRRGGPLPPPLTTLARGASRVRMVHERRDGRLAVYAVRTPGLEAERRGGRLLMRLLPLLPLPGAGGNVAAAAACHRQETRAEKEEEAKEAEEEEAKQADEEEEYSVAKYVRGGRCVEPEGGAAAAAARRGQQWEPEQAAAFWVATS